MSTERSSLESLYGTIELLKSGESLGFEEIQKEFSSWIESLKPQDRKDILQIVIGLLYSSITGLTPEASHLAGISQYCRTNGVLQYVLSHIISPRKTSTFDERPYLYIADNHSGGDDQFVCDLEADSDKMLTASQRVFDKNGYSILPRQVEKDHLIQIEAELESYKLTPGDGEYEGRSILIDTDNPVCIRANYDPKDLRSSDIIMRLPYKYNFDKIAERVLGKAAFLQSVDCWYNFPNRFGTFHPIYKDSAQSFHFDMPGVDWLHFFIYLTRVTSENGPHAFIPCTSLPLSKSETLLRRGYQRVLPQEAYNYEHRSERQLCGPAGLIIQARTASWHRGVAVKSGYRKILQYVFGIHPFQRNIAGRLHY